MKLDELRTQIDEIDSSIKQLFEKRMRLCQNIALEKMKNNLPIFQSDREAQVLKKASEGIDPSFAAASRVLFTNIMDISKSIQQSSIDCPSPLTLDIRQKLANPLPIPKTPLVACPGISGSYSHIAAKKFFPDANIKFFDSFDMVTEAIESGECDFGVLPIENSSAGSVRDVYELIKKKDFYINFETKIKIEHCLAVKKGLAICDIEKIYSHEQALAQCSEFIKSMKIPSKSFANTALAAQYVAESDKPIAALCSVEAAEEFGLTILKKGVQDIDENYTRFICISKNLYPSEKAGMISISLAIPNVAGSLYRLLTKFAVNSFDMSKIESKPIGNKNFDVIFYIDFYANLYDKNAQMLIDDLSKEFSPFKFLGNFIKVD